MWPCGRCITSLCGWGSLILGHHAAKFGIYRPCKIGIITFSICHVTTISKSHVTLWMWSSHPAKFGVYKPDGTGNNIVCNISSNSNSISNTIPMLRFQCRSLQMTRLVQVNKQDYWNSLKTILCKNTNY